MAGPYGSADADPYDATRAVTALRADYERWSRWIGLPFRSGAAAPSARGWAQARLVNFEPPLFVRVITAATAFLLAVAGIAVLGRGIVEGEDIALAIAAGAVGLISLVAGCVQVGGVMRIVQGFATADPVWRRVAG